MKKSIFASNAPKPVGAYSPGILIGNTLFVSGQVPLDPTTGILIDKDIEKQATLVMNNIFAILQEAGMDWSNVVKASIFLSDMNNFGKVNEIYGSFFIEPFPARECVQVSRLPKDVDVEISVIAIKS